MLLKNAKKNQFILVKESKKEGENRKKKGNRKGKTLAKCWHFYAHF